MIRYSVVIVLLFLFSFYPYSTYAINTTEFSSNLSSSAMVRALKPTESPNTITLAASISLAISGSVGGVIAYKSVGHQKKQRELAAMLEAFKILNNNEHRRARENVYCAFHLFDKKGRKDIFKGNPYHENAAMVRADMDQMGLLIHQELIDKNIFLQAYWNTVLVCWKALKDDIKREQIEREYPSYMEHFRWLNDEAMEYRRLHHPDSKIKVSSADDCDVRIQEELQKNKRYKNKPGL